MRVLIFDSGIGGLSVARDIRALLPDVSYIYAADDVFRPYGSKTPAQLKARLPGLLRTLELTCQPDVIVIACNTASTTCLPSIREVCDAPIVGVVPAIKPAAKMSRSKSIGVLGTPATVAHEYVDRLITDFAGDCHVSLCGSTLLVEMAEQKLTGTPVDLTKLKAEIAPLFPSAIPAADIIVLACTHFPLLTEELAKVTPQGTRFIDSGAAIARRVKTLLETVPMSPKDEFEDTALLIGPDPSPARRAAFAQFGFNRVVGLRPQCAPKMAGLIP